MQLDQLKYSVLSSLGESRRGEIIEFIYIFAAIVF